MRNVLIQETIEKFGYDPNKLKTNSCKLVICLCEICNSQREKPFRNRNQICLNCSNKKNSNTNLEKRSKLVKSCWETNGHPRQGKPHSEESKQKISIAKLKNPVIWTDEKRKEYSLRFSGTNNPFYGKRHKEESKRIGKNNCRYGKPPSHSKKCWYNGICFRSSYEVKVAQYLDFNNIKWTYETDILEIECIINQKIVQTTYRPDFYLIDTNQYLEVKGYWYRGYREKFEAALLTTKIPIILWDKCKLKEMKII